nr:PREDICTED: bromodomain-containing protein 4-like [Bemisia tabaci]
MFSHREAYPFSHYYDYEPFIRAVEKFPQLYNRKHPLYWKIRGYPEKRSTWEDVGRMCNFRPINASDIQTVWETLRQSYTSYRLRKRENEALGKAPPTWKYAEAMSFLEPYLLHKRRKNPEVQNANATEGQKILSEKPGTSADLRSNPGTCDKSNKPASNIYHVSSPCPCDKHRLCNHGGLPTPSDSSVTISSVDADDTDESVSLSSFCMADADSVKGQMLELPQTQNEPPHTQDEPPPTQDGPPPARRVKLEPSEDQTMSHGSPPTQSMTSESFATEQASQMSPVEYRPRVSPLEEVTLNSHNVQQLGQESTLTQRVSQKPSLAQPLSQETPFIQRVSHEPSLTQSSSQGSPLIQRVSHEPSLTQSLSQGSSLIQRASHESSMTQPSNQKSPRIQLAQPLIRESPKIQRASRESLPVQQVTLESSWSEQVNSQSPSEERMRRGSTSFEGVMSSTAQQVSHESPQIGNTSFSRRKVSLEPSSREGLRSESSPDALALFFVATEATVRRLNPVLQIQAKAKISALMAELEMQSLFPDA